MDIEAELDPDTTVVAIDEVQFFDEGVVEVCEALAEQGRRVICAGLDMDFQRCSIWPNAPAYGPSGAGEQAACHMRDLRQ